MRCEQYQDLMSGYLDAELDPAATLDVGLHLASCAACTGELARLRSVQAAIGKHATRHAAPAHLKHRIRTALREHQEHQERQEQSGRRAWRRSLAALPWAWINLAFGAAASAAFAVTLALYLARPTDTERLNEDIVASHFRSLMPDHLADVASSDEHTVKPWFAGKLDFSPPVVDLAQQGFALIGGRVDYVNARPVAALAYRHRKHVLNLYLWPDKAQREAAPHAASMQGFQLLHWTQAGMHYAAVSDMNAADLGQFARQLKARNETQDETRNERERAQQAPAASPIAPETRGKM